MSPTAMEYGKYMGIGLVMANAGVYALQTSPRPEPDDSTFIYSGCVIDDFPIPWGETEAGMSLYLAQVAYPEEATKLAVAPDEVPAFLRHLKRILDLNTSELAEICGVSRPTIYSWRKGITPDSHNLKRLGALSGLVHYWANHFGQDVVSAPKIPANEELKYRLRSESLELDPLEQMLSTLADEVVSNETSRPKSARELLEEHDMELPPEDVEERNMLMVKIGSGRGR